MNVRFPTYTAIIALIFSVGVSSCQTRFSEGTAVMYGTVHAATITVTSGTSGEVNRITKQPGDPVKRGELLVRLDAADSAGELSRAKKRLADAVEQEKNAKAELDRTTDEVSYSRGRYLTFAYLLKRGAVATKEVERLKDEWDFAELQNEKAKVYYSRAETELEEARADLAQTEAEYGSIFILSPADGFLTRLVAWEGGYLLKGDRALVVAPAGEIYFTGRIAADKPVSLGDDAEIFPLAVPTGTVKGYVAAIADGDNTGSTARTVTVRLFPKSKKDVANIGKHALGVVYTGR
jgi:multidrug resistance efflux pump